MIEQTLVLVKPDGVKRGLIGDITKRLEQRGLKIVGMKMKQVSPEFAGKHYTWEDIGARHGEKVRNNLITFLTSGPVVAMVVEGVNAVENIRKLAGTTEPRTALPGTIRGDYCHISYHRADSKDVSIYNVVHASAKPDEAEKEIALWFSRDEICSYKTAHEDHVM